MPRLDIELQNESHGPCVPDERALHVWVRAALDGAGFAGDAELTCRVVDEAEGRELNAQWRGKDYATNVLSFPLDMPEEAGIPYLGDLVVCAPVVGREAAEQGKDVEAHWAHLIVHGVLHLLGFDHIDNAEAEEMERLEVHVLATLGYPDPYLQD
ncbi:MAG: rRNA maturation RNase YbeY [Halothiobacillaceae bacterium]|jgi:probable rRNA maturation factor|nr:rRNA maturation RNase YbeY [Halothiobacillaceae bacterium]